VTDAEIGAAFNDEAGRFALGVRVNDPHAHHFWTELPRRP
jgi:hypothetical protein